MIEAAFLLAGLLAGVGVVVLSHRIPRKMEIDWREDLAGIEGAVIPPVDADLHSWPLPRRGEPVPMRYPVIIAAAMMLTAATGHVFGHGLNGLAAILLVWILLTLAAIDLETQLLPDNLTLPLLWLGLLFNWYGGFVDLSSAVMGAIAGYMSLWVLYWAFRLISGKEGMGYGDFKLFAALGAWFGWQQLPMILVISSVLLLLVGFVLMLFRRQDRAVPMAFGPYLAGAGVVAMFWGKEFSRSVLGIWY